MSSGKTSLVPFTGLRSSFSEAALGAAPSPTRLSASWSTAALALPPPPAAAGDGGYISQCGPIRGVLSWCRLVPWCRGVSWFGVVLSCVYQVGVVLSYVYYNRQYVVAVLLCCRVFRLRDY